MSDTLFYVLFAPAVISLCGWIGVSAWLTNRVEWLRSRGYSPDLLPDRSFGRSALNAWAWTGAYLQLKDKRIARAVIFYRALLIAFPISLLCLGEVGWHFR